MRALAALKLTKNINKIILNSTKIEQTYFTFRTFHCKNVPLKFATTFDGGAQKALNPCLKVSSRCISTTCTLAKAKDKGKKEKHGKPQQIDENELREVVDLKNLTSNFERSIEDLRNEFIKHLTLRSTTGSIEQIPVTFDGQEYLLQELVEIARKPKTIVLDVSSFPQAIPQVLEALNKSGLNLNPQQDGTTLFIPIPKVTKEHRENLAKNAKALFIKCRDQIKEIRNKEIKNLKKKPSLSEDLARRVQLQLETLTDRYLVEAQNILDTKQKELLRPSD